MGSAGSDLLWESSAGRRVRHGDVSPVRKRLFVGIMTSPMKVSEQVFEPDDEALQRAHVSNGEEDSRHKGAAVVRVMAQREGLAQSTEDHLLMSDIAGKADTVDMDAVERGAAPPRQFLDRIGGRRRRPGSPRLGDLPSRHEGGSRG